MREKGERTAEKDQARYPRLRAESHIIWPYYIKGVWKRSNVSLSQQRWLDNG
jgi:hypothetical protein